MRHAPVQELTPSDAYALFTCCTTAYAPGNPKAGLALLQLLRLSGTPVGNLGTAESCCGDPALNMGDRDMFQSLRQSNLDLFEEQNVKKLLVSSPHCLTTFTNNYPGLSDGIFVEHYTQLLDRLLDEGRLIPAEKLAATVTFHDPCYLGRHNGIYQEPRQVLQRIPGLDLVEMKHHRKDSRCCGGGGCGAWSGESHNPSVGISRVNEALDTGAGIIAVACPYCLRILDRAVKRAGVDHRISVRDIAELLLQSVAMNVAAGNVASEAPGIAQEVCHG